MAATLASYDTTGAAYRLTVLLPLSAEDYDTEPNGWQSLTINERNSLALAYALTAALPNPHRPATNAHD